jgi:hypothetical protein
VNQTGPGERVVAGLMGKLAVKVRGAQREARRQRAHQREPRPERRQIAAAEREIRLEHRGRDTRAR